MERTEFIITVHCNSEGFNGMVKLLKKALDNECIDYTLSYNHPEHENFRYRII